MGDLNLRLKTYLQREPQLGRDVFIAPGAVLIGDVTLGDGSSVWYNAVLRGDINRIVIGTGSNVQDCAVLHLSDDYGCVVGDHVTIGHGAIVHACTVGNEVLVGMGSTILDGADIGEQSIIGAKALVTEGMRVPPGSLILGVPAKVVRVLTTEERAWIRTLADKYVQAAAWYRRRQEAAVKPV